MINILVTQFLHTPPHFPKKKKKCWLSSLASIIFYFNLGKHINCCENIATFCCSCKTTKIKNSLESNFFYLSDFYISQLHNILKKKPFSFYLFLFFLFQNLTSLNYTIIVSCNSNPTIYISSLYLSQASCFLFLFLTTMK